MKTLDTTSFTSIAAQAAKLPDGANLHGKDGKLYVSSQFSASSVKAKLHLESGPKELAAKQHAAAQTIDSAIRKEYGDIVANHLAMSYPSGTMPTTKEGIAALAKKLAMFEPLGAAPATTVQPWTKAKPTGAKQDGAEIGQARAEFIAQRHADNKEHVMQLRSLAAELGKSDLVTLVDRITGGEELTKAEYSEMIEGLHSISVNKELNDLLAEFDALAEPTVTTVPTHASAELAENEISELDQLLGDLGIEVKPIRTETTAKGDLAQPVEPQVMTEKDLDDLIASLSVKG